jgi:hypothetical protein
MKAGNLFRRIRSADRQRSQDDAKGGEAEWRASVTKDLDNLTTVVMLLHTDVDEVKSARPSTFAVLLAIALLVVTAGLVVGSAVFGVDANSTHDAAAQLYLKAQSDALQVDQFNKDIFDVSVGHPNGSPYSSSQQRQVQGDEASIVSFQVMEIATDRQADINEHNATQEDYVAQPALAISGAGFGAVAGWILTTYLGGMHPRKPGRPSPKAVEPDGLSALRAIVKTCRRGHR